MRRKQDPNALESRAGRFDRGDFEQRADVVAQAGDFATGRQKESSNTSTSGPEKASEARARVATADDNVTREHLRNLGYTASEIDTLITGPIQNSEKGNT